MLAKVQAAIPTESQAFIGCFATAGVFGDHRYVAYVSVTFVFATRGQNNDRISTVSFVNSYIAPR